VVHIAGKPRVKTWDRDGWSEASSIPGCATIIPSGRPTGWLVDGELDVVTLSIAEDQLRACLRATSSTGCASPFPTRWARR
jgi:AraC family transcriptional regulator